MIFKTEKKTFTLNNKEIKQFVFEMNKSKRISELN